MTIQAYGKRPDKSISNDRQKMAGQLLNDKITVVSTVIRVKQYHLPQFYQSFRHGDARRAMSPEWDTNKLSIVLELCRVRY